MKTACILLATLTLAACITADDPAPRTELDGVAQAALKPLGPAEQFSLSADNCLQHLDARDRDQSRAWCALASRRAVSRLDKVGWPYPEGELDRELTVVRKALWMSAVDGLGMQNNPWWGVPRSETIPIGNDVRRLAYVMLADFNRQDIGHLDFNFERLGLVVGIKRDPSETLGQFRARVLERLDELTKLAHGPLDFIDSLWAKAVVGLTLAIDDKTDDPAVEGKALATLLSGLADGTEGLQGEDAALAPVVYLALGSAHFLANDLVQADAAFSKGDALCSRSIWTDAALCELLNSARLREASPSSSPIPADRIAARTLQRLFNPH